MSDHPVNVLLVEDNPEHAYLFQQMLTSAEAIASFRVSSAESLSSTLERLRRGGIDLILLDLSLPDSDGIETFIRVVEAAPDIPIVVMSGLSDVAVAIETVQLGAQDYLVKGHFDNHLVLRSMQYAVERKRVQLQLKHARDE